MLKGREPTFLTFNVSGVINIIKVEFLPYKIAFLKSLDGNAERKLKTQREGRESTPPYQLEISRHLAGKFLSMNLAYGMENEPNKPGLSGW